MMNGNKISKGLAIFVILTGGAVMIGWIFDIAILKSILPVWITMKFSTAICFVSSGIMILSIINFHETRSEYVFPIISITCLVILMFMGLFLASSFLRINLGIDELFIVEAQRTQWIAGRPSVYTMFAFILITIAGLLSISNVTRLKSKLLFIGWTILLLGTSASLGYVFNIPVLSFDIKGWSNPMACHTSILFIALGASLIFLKDKD